MTETNSKPDILLVEDNPGDVRLTREAFRDAEIDVQIHVATDGVNAIGFLKDEDTRFPDLVLLDLNLPRKDGFQVLDTIRSDPDLEHLPVIVLSSSSAKEDIVLSYEEHANAYLTKPNMPDEFVEMVQSVEEFWMENVRLPTFS